VERSTGLLVDTASFVRLLMVQGARNDRMLLPEEETAAVIDQDSDYGYNSL
jgi:hypothetical protein